LRTPSPLAHSRNSRYDAKGHRSFIKRARESGKKGGDEMNPHFRSRPAWLGAGLVVGLVVGLNVEGLWPTAPLHASATHGIDKFAIATGLVDNNVEALYFLDFLTGDMRAAVINPKTGKFNAYFSRNIAADFGNAGRNSGYLMITGSVNMPRGTASFQYAQSIVYVAEASTAQVAAYTIPWNSTLHNAGKTQYGEFQPLDVKPFRTAFVRDAPAQPAAP
jgi:hypothetical protein